MSSRTFLCGSTGLGRTASSKVRGETCDLYVFVSNDIEYVLYHTYYIKATFFLWFLTYSATTGKPARSSVPMLVYFLFLTSAGFPSCSTTK